MYNKIIITIVPNKVYCSTWHGKEKYSFQWGLYSNKFEHGKCEITIIWV